VMQRGRIVLDLSGDEARARIHEIEETYMTRSAESLEE
jgi:hypothetical protein